MFSDYRVEIRTLLSSAHTTLRRIYPNQALWVRYYDVRYCANSNGYIASVIVSTLDEREDYIQEDDEQSRG